MINEPPEVFREWLIHDINTNDDLQDVINVCTVVMDKMNIENIDNVSISLSDNLDVNGKHIRRANERIGKVYIKRGIPICYGIICVAHELGHEVTETGSLKLKLIAESTACSFESHFLKVFGEITKFSINVERAKWYKTIKQNGLGYFVGSLITFNPLNRLIKEEYRKTKRKE